ncbi:MAG: VOC family protein [Longimicrobiales bacterium]
MTEGEFQGLRTVIYSVQDLPQAKQWYTQALGHGPYFDEPYYVGFDVGGFELGLLPTAEGAPTGAGGVTAYWGVDDADAALARLLELGADQHRPVEDVGEGIRVATVTDPWGNLLGIIKNPHFDRTRVG